ncbi:hypothetical protein BMS3Abin06_01869 [bacterium BMS3Abin06]|nr:hypothetical protein BMS3Abin06_01869 [bacterium BMS3Abin06]
MGRERLLGFIGALNRFSLKSKALLENMDMGWNVLGFNVDEEITVDNGLQNSLFNTV